MSDSAADGGETRVAEPGSTAVILAVGLGLLGAALGAASPWLADAALRLPWIPLGGPLRLIDELAGRLGWWPFALAGMVLGVIGGLVLHAAEPEIAVSDRAIVITRGNERTRFARSQIGLAAIEGQHLVLRDREDVELAYQKLDTRLATELAAALQRHGWGA